MQLPLPLQAYELLRALLANETAIAEQSLTLGPLEKLYLESPQRRAKGQRSQREDQRKLERVVKSRASNPAEQYGIARLSWIS